MNWLWKKKVNPLQTDTERAASEVLKVLVKYGTAIDRKETLSTVVKRGLGGYFHIHGNPTKKAEQKAE